MSKIDPIALASDLIRCPSVTPDDRGAIGVLIAALEPLGFNCTILTFEEDGHPPVKNLFARRGTEGSHFCFAGHTDVVPAGDTQAWSIDPFSAVQKDGQLWGRGASDMKSAIAAFVAAAANNNDANNSISLLITGDEEGAAINGTRKVLQWMADNDQVMDHCLVGEPTNPEAFGEMVKVGRRGSINGWITVKGQQGHVAYPHRAKNPIPALCHILAKMSATPLDDGYENFQPSSFQITDLNVGNHAHNVIPAKATARFNVRFNPNWTGAAVHQWVEEQVAALNPDKDLSCHLETIISGEAFLTTDRSFIDVIAESIQTITGREPERSTTGGTSDARFIREYAPVAEFGLVGATMHQVDEHVSVDDIYQLENVYGEILKRYFQTAGQSS